MSVSPNMASFLLDGANVSKASLRAWADQVEDAVGLGAGSAVSDASTFFNPEYFTNPADGAVGRLNRLLIGAASLGSSDIPASDPDWLEDLITNSVALAQFAVSDTIGTLAVVGGAQTGQYRSVFGSASGGSQGITGIGWNNDLGAGNPIAAGIVGIGVHADGCTGVTLNQFDINSSHTVVDTDPNMHVVGGSTFGLGLTPGAYASLATEDVTAALYIGPGLTTKFRKGGIIFTGALDTAVGHGGGGMAWEFPAGASIEWTNALGGTDSAIWGGSSGLTVFGRLNVGLAGLNHGMLTIGGITSGTIITNPQNAAGTWWWNWPTSAGTAGKPLISAGSVDGTTPLTWATLGASGGGTGVTDADFSADWPNTALTSGGNLTAGSGSFTTASGTLWCRTMGKQTEFHLDISITTNNTAAGSVNVTLPVTAKRGGQVLGREATTGTALMGVLTAGSNQLIIVNLTGSGYPGGDGKSLSMSGLFHST